jgi:hypothetical protein
VAVNDSVSVGLSQSDNIIDTGATAGSISTDIDPTAESITAASSIAERSSFKAFSMYLSPGPIVDRELQPPNRNHRN